MRDRLRSCINGIQGDDGCLGDVIETAQCAVQVTCSYYFVCTYSLNEAGSENHCC